MQGEAVSANIEATASYPEQKIELQSLMKVAVLNDRFQCRHSSLMMEEDAT